MKWVLRIFKWVGVAFAGLTLLTCTGAVWLIEVPFLLVVGWVYFLGGVMPGVTFRWGAIAETLAVVAVLGVGTHLLLGRLWRQLRAEQAQARPWPVRWSVSLVALLVLLFSATMATVGIGHQVGWMLSGPEPLVESSWRSMREGQRNRELCEKAVRLTGQGLSEARVLQQLLADPETRAAAEQMHAVRLQGPTEAPLYVIFPRDPVVREQTGGQRCGTRYEDQVPVSASELPQLLTERRVAADTPP